MYLSKVKLSGFKSFVDHTVFELTDRLNGIVGPNGCGKSNIIDAIRWVMGESSAKQLRGESMSDVIFSGATSRKASSFASIELVFDNSEGRIGGQWAIFSEISIKRILERNGQSTYYLNGARCRRKDITDIFLGTGLGSRSYAIIEQGTISRVVESKADELRLVFEEAAGVSKYKEQKRETETRIEHTRQNLLRLLDVREELSVQLTHLEKQARKAEDYTLLKQEERQLQYLSLKKKRADIVIELKTLDDKIEVLRETFHNEVEKYNELIISYNSDKQDLTIRNAELAQQVENYHAKEREILVLQHKIDSLRKQHEWSENEFQKQSAQIVQIKEERAVNEANQVELLEKKESKEESLLILNESLFEMEEALTDSNQALEVLMNDVKSVNDELITLGRRSDVSKNSIKHRELKQSSDQANIQKLTDELSTLLSQKINKSKHTELQENIEQKRVDLELMRENSAELKEILTELTHQRDDIEKNIQINLRKEAEFQGKRNALIALQDSFKQQNEAVQSSLFETLTIDEFWQKATEVVLSRYLMLSTEENEQGYILGKNSFEFTVKHLGYYVKSEYGLGSVLSNVFIAKSKEEAIQMQSSLKLNEYVVLENGDLYGSDWFVNHESIEVQGVLERAEEIQFLEKELETLTMTLTMGQEAKETIVAEETEAQQQLNRFNYQIQELNSVLVNAEKEFAVINNEMTHFLEKKSRIEQALEHLKIQSSEDLLIKEEDLIELESIAIHQEDKAEKRSALQTSLEQAQNNQQAENVKHLGLKDKINEEKRTLDGINYQLQEIDKNLQRLAMSEVTITNQMQSREENSGNNDELITLEEMLMSHNDSLIEIDAMRIESSETVGKLQAKITEDERHKEVFEKKIADQKEHVQEMMVKGAEIKARQAHTEESWDKLLEILSEDELQSLAQDMIEIDHDNIENLLKITQNKLSKIGAVNLVAIEECKVLSERKIYLDEQDADLNKALFELETAINKIDKETRERFMETFDTVSQDFSSLFPRLFGGGEAYLELEGNDVLVSGVNIIARPPGKKPGTIHLLSGGEKALTAAALVFAIFNLNPAPFCILDEVDAPLDEANVRRLGSLLQEMCDRVQFIFITHNKTTMSIAESLIGVTMSEPGVSRLVSVDLTKIE